MSVSLETDRLILRPFTEADTDAYAVIRAKPEVMRFLASGAASTHEETHRRAAANIAAFHKMWTGIPGYGPWAVIEKETGRLRGHLGLRQLEEFDNHTELLYMLDSTVWGRGYATEGARAALDYGFKTLKLQEIIGFVLPENTASARVLEKVGMRPELDLIEIFGLNAALYALRSADYEVEQVLAPIKR